MIEEKTNAFSSPEKTQEGAVEKQDALSLLIIALILSVVANLMASYFTISWLVEFVQKGPGATAARMELGVLWLYFIIWPIAALLALPLTAGSFIGMMKKGKPLHLCLPLWILSFLYLLQIGLQLFFLLFH